MALHWTSAFQRRHLGIVWRIHGNTSSIVLFSVFFPQLGEHIERMFDHNSANNFSLFSRHGLAQTFHEQLFVP